MSDWREDVEALRRSLWRGSGHSHWDSTMRHGAGCETCIEQRAGRAEAEKLIARLEARLEGLERCPLCQHEWRRHDPEDGKCDAGSDELGACRCGRDPAYHRVRNAALSYAALAAAAPWAKGER